MLGLPSLNLLTAGSQLVSKLSENTNDRLVDEPVAHEKQVDIVVFDKNTDRIYRMLIFGR